MLTIEETAVFKKIIKRGFSERRKKLMKLLKHDWPTEAVIAIFRTLGLDEKIRGEKVSLEQFIENIREFASQSALIRPTGQAFRL